jgi:hypothetical protein
MGSQKQFTKISFPSDVEVHHEWIDLDEMLRQKVRLKYEADLIVKKVNNLLKEDNQRIWLFYGLNQSVTSIMKDALDRNFEVEGVRLVAGSLYTEIIVYKKRQ